jgi:hypothetical protein
MVAATPASAGATPSVPVDNKRLRELISELEMLSAEAVEHAEGWTAT